MINALLTFNLVQIKHGGHTIFKDVRANCFCASSGLLRTQIHATSWMSARIISDQIALHSVQLTLLLYILLTISVVIGQEPPAYFENSRDLWTSIIIV